jgi:hypothetical protein
MVLRFATKNLSIGPGGTTIAHGLGVIPDEYWLNIKGTPSVSANSIASFSAVAVDTTNIYVTAGVIQTVDVFAVASHSVIK